MTCIWRHNYVNFVLSNWQQNFLKANFLMETDIFFDTLWNIVVQITLKKTQLKVQQKRTKQIYIS